MALLISLPFDSNGTQVQVIQPPGVPGSHRLGYLFESGWDFGLALGSEVLASGPGRVLSSRDELPTTGNPSINDSGLGNYVTIIFNEGTASSYYASYLHLAQNSVTDLINVSAGDVIGHVGGSGGYDTHLHFQVGETLIELSAILPTGENVQIANGTGALNLIEFQVFSDQSWYNDIDLGWILVDTFRSNYGTALDDIAIGSNDDDGFFGLGGNDAFDGLDGVDTVFLSGKEAEYSIFRVGEHIVTDGPDGRDEFARIEVLAFDDGSKQFNEYEDNFVTTYGEQINHTYDPSLGRQYVKELTTDTFWFKLEGIGLSAIDMLGTTTIDVLKALFLPTIVHAADGESVTEFTSSALPDDLWLASTYTNIGIEGYGSTAISHIINDTTPTVADDHGDNATSASTVGSVGSYEYTMGNIETIDDEDWFKVNLVEDQQYTFLLTATHSTYSEIDPILYLHNASENVITSNDDLTASNLSAFISYTATYSGVFYLSAGGSASTIGSYNLFATNLSSNGDAISLVQTNQPDDTDIPNYWDWEGDNGDNNPNTFTLEQGGAPSVNADNKYRGHDGDDKIEAGRGDDIILGDDDDDRLYGEDGNDVLYGGDDEDRLYGGDDDDELHGERGDDLLKGDSGDDYLHGGRDDDRLHGGTGEDYLKGGRGNDELDGDENDDELYGDEGDDIIDGGDGDDLLFGGDGNDMLDGDNGDDRLAGEDGNDILDGDDGDDLLFGGGDDDILEGGRGNDLLHGESGNDTADYSDGNDGVVVNLFDGTALSTDLGRDTLFDIENVLGSDGDDVIDGDHGVNEIFGADGNDLIRGHNENDIIDGGDDDDIVWGDEGNDTVRGGRGNDEVRGGLGDDHLEGGLGDDELRGEQGDDVIVGGDGNDIAMFWGERDDFLITQNGNGSYRIEDIRSNGQEGVDTVSEVEVFRFFGNDVAVADILSAAPNAVNDTVLLNEDSPIIFDPISNDTDIDGDPLQIVSVDVGPDELAAYIVAGEIVFDPRGKFDDLDLGESAFVNIGYTISDGTGWTDNGQLSIEITGAKELVSLPDSNGNLRGSGAHEELLGDWRDNEIKAFSGNDILNGKGGNDTLIGGDGNDELFGAQGSDALYGGYGDDLLKGNSDNDRLIGGSGDDVIYGGDGNDIIKGREGNDELFGEDGNDIIYADGGLDVLYGGNGDDFLYGGRDNDTMGGGNGKDKLKGNLGNDVMNGGDGSDELRGGGGNDQVNGGWGSDFLFGENGADILTGGLGNDAMTGGADVDTFVFTDISSGFDRIKDYENGIDKIDVTSFGFSAFSDVQALTSNTSLGMRIDFGNGNVLFVENFNTDDFDAGDVIL